MAHKTRGLLFLAATLTIVAGACGSSSHKTAEGSTSTTSAPASVSTTTSPSADTAPSGSSSTSTATPATSATSATSAVTTASGLRECQTSSLKGSLTGASGTAGSVYYQLVLTNTGPATCVVQGYAGVSFVTGSQGQQVGAAAARTPAATPAVTLGPGASAQATLQIAEAGIYDNCGLTDTDGLRIYPPDETAALLIDHDDQACSDTSDVTLHVGPFQ